MNKPQIGLSSTAIARLAGVVVSLIGALAFLPWIIGVGGVGRSIPAMAPNTAIGFILAGGCLCLLAREGTAGPAKLVASVAAAGIFLLGGLTLIEHLRGKSLGLDGLLVRENAEVGITAASLRPSFLTCLNFLSLGLGLILIDARTRLGRWPVDLLAVLPLAISLLALIGYAVGVPSFYGRMQLFPNTAMTLATVWAFILLAAGMLAARPGQGLTRLLLSPTAGGVVARRLLLAPVLIPLATGLVSATFARLKYFNPEFAGWAISFVNIFTFTLLIWWIAMLLDREGKLRESSEDQVRRANAELEQRVAARTAELEEAVNRSRWLASFPERNPNPIIEVSLADGRIDYANPYASQLFPTLQLEGFQHSWLAGLREEAATSTWAATPVRRRVVEIGPNAYAQTIGTSGNGDRLRVYGNDITELRQVEKALLRERNLLRTLIDNLPSCIYIKDLDGRFLVYNQASVAMTGVGSEDKALGKTVHDLFPREIADLYAADDRRVLDSGEPIIEREEPTEDHEGRARWFLTTKVPLRDSSGLMGLLGISQDITERKEVEATLRATMAREQESRIKAQLSEDRFRTLVEQSLVGIYVLQDDKFAYVNPCMEQILGYTTEQLKAMPILESVHPEDRAMVRENVRKRLDGIMAQVHYALRVVRPDGSVRHAEARGATSEYNGRPAILGTLLDITERRRAEENLRVLNLELEQRVLDRTHQLEEANRELEAFSYSVSHDLRAPLRHVHGYVEMLRRDLEGQLTEKQQRFMRTIISASVEMGQLIDDLLAFSRMSRVEFHERTVNLNHLLDDVIRGLEMAVKDRTIEWRIAPLPPVTGDPATLKVVLVNLVGNAVKYTRKREAALIEVDHHGEEDGRLVFRVRDNGAGFDMRYAQKLFGVFQRLHRADEFEGTGIGLATVRRVVQRHGGRTWAEGAPDQGATFYFTLKPA